jgi:hypothetical protein
MKPNPNREYSTEEKILITLLTVEEHLKFFRIVLVIYIVLSIIGWIWLNLF